MKRIYLFALAAGSVMGQPLEFELTNRLAPFQVLTTTASSGTYSLSMRSVKGRPFSATEENCTLQVLGNGTRIENKTVNKLYRDNEGRTRTEDAQGIITIVDPVAGFRATLNPKTKTVTKVTNGVNGASFGVATATGVRIARMGDSGSELKEALGLQSVNGVTARGERVTVTIPKGEIGNDRELKVVNERWTSEELQMLVKSTNSDPRYGDTTYELIGISLAVPDLALFQIPADYAVSENVRTVQRVTIKSAQPPTPPKPAVGIAPGGKQ
ncbi:MAG: hypothetical protein ABIR70_05555 [Bryobacteraceae bacterium]